MAGPSWAGAGCWPLATSEAPTSLPVPPSPSSPSPAVPPVSPSAAFGVVASDWLSDCEVGEDGYTVALGCPLYLHHQRGNGASEGWTPGSSAACEDECGGDGEVGAAWCGWSESGGCAGVGSGSDGGCERLLPSSLSSSPSSSSLSFSSLPLSPLSDSGSEECEERASSSSSSLSSDSTPSPRIAPSPRCSPRAAARLGSVAAAGGVVEAVNVSARRCAGGRARANVPAPLRNRKRRLTASSPDAQGRRSPIASVSSSSSSSSPVWRAQSDPPPPARGWVSSTSPSSSPSVSSSSPSCSSPGECEEVDKRERNKQSAADYRKRRKVYVISLEAKLADAAAQLQEAQTSCKRLTAENQVLRQSMQVLSTIVHQRSDSPQAAAREQASRKSVSSTAKPHVSLPSSAVLLVPPPYRPVAPSLQADGCALGGSFSGDVSEAAEGDGLSGGRARRAVKPAARSRAGGDDASRSQRGAAAGVARKETRQKQVAGTLMAVLFSCFLLYLPWLVHLDTAMPSSLIFPSALHSSVQLLSPSSSPHQPQSALLTFPDCGLQPWTCHKGRALFALHTQQQGDEATEARRSQRSDAGGDALLNAGEESCTRLDLAHCTASDAEDRGGEQLHPLLHLTTSSAIGVSGNSNDTASAPHQPSSASSTASSSLSVLAAPSSATLTAGDVSSGSSATTTTTKMVGAYI